MTPSYLKIKTHLAIPEDLVAEVDRIAGKRRRSLFIAEATREKLAKERFLKVLEETSVEDMGVRFAPLSKYLNDYEDGKPYKGVSFLHAAGI